MAADFFIASRNDPIYSNSDMSVLLEQALKLPIPERQKLADDIYDSIDASADSFSLTPEQEAELARRIEDHRLHPEDAIPWEQVLAEALARK